MFQPGDEKIFHLNPHKGNYQRLFLSSWLTITIVPIIVVYTKVDLVLPTVSKARVSAESYFKERWGQSFETLTKSQIPYTVVASMLWSEVSWVYTLLTLYLASLPETLTRLVDMTLKVVRIEPPSPTSPLPRGRNQLSVK